MKLPVADYAKILDEVLDRLKCIDQITNHGIRPGYVFKRQLETAIAQEFAGG